MKRLVEKILGNSAADAAPCFGCDGYYQYRCANTQRQRRWVTTYGCRCQNKSYSSWRQVGCCSYPCAV